MRIALGVEYDGSRYHGWQKQPNLKTVQGILERAISKIASHEVGVVCAGRTDTGVHALNQVVHFDSESERSLRAWIYGVNSQLPRDISIRWSEEVPDDFSARFSATGRYYRYVIFNHAIRPAQLRSHITWQYRELDVTLMHEAAQSLQGCHDFTSFRSTECQAKSPSRTVSDISVSRSGDVVYIDIKANAFLHHMVRNIAGVLMAVGNGKRPVEWVSELLSEKNRALGAETAPPYGLYLMDVSYDPELALPGRYANPLFFEM